MKKTEKTVLKITVTADGTRLTAYNRLTVYEFINSTENTAEHYVSRRKTTELCSVPLDNSTAHGLKYTDYFTAVLEEISPKIAYRALMTVYKKSADKTVLALLNQLRTIASDSDFIVSLEGDEVKTMQGKKMHSYRIGKDGKRHEIIPYETLEYTQFARDVFAVQADIAKNANSNDINDILQVVKLSLVELFNCDLLHCVADIHNYKSYVYSRVHNYINAMRSINSRIDTCDFRELVTMVDEKQNTLVFCGKNATQLLDKVQVDKELLHDVLSVVYGNMPKLKKELNRDVVELFFKGMSKEKIAHFANVSVHEVQRTIDIIRRLANIPEVNELLHNLLLD